MTFGEEMVQTAVELLEEFGLAVYITSPVSGIDPNTLLPVPGVPIGTGLAASFTPGRSDSPENSLNEESMKNHKWFYAYSEVDLKSGHVIGFVGGSKYLIKSVKRFSVQETTVFYELATSEV